MLSLKPIIQDLEDLYISNKHSVLCRLVLKVKDCNSTNIAAQLAFLPKVYIRLVLYDGDCIIGEAVGRGSAVIRSSTLFIDDAKRMASKNRYILEATVESDEKILAQSRLLNSTLISKSAKKIEESKKLLGQTLPPSNEDRWKLRIICTEPGSVIIAKDTDKKDSQRALKESWETHQPGRSQIAKEIRESYVKSVDTGLIAPVIFTLPQGEVKPWTVIQDDTAPLLLLFSENQKISHELLIEPTGRTSERDEDRVVYQGRVLNTAAPVLIGAEQIQKACEHQISRIDEFQKLTQDVRLARLSEKEMRQNFKRIQAESVDLKQKEVESWVKVDEANRDAYRKRILREHDEILAAQEAATRAQEQLNDQQAEDLAPKKKGKKGAL